MREITQSILIPALAAACLAACAGTVAQGAAVKHVGAAPRQEEQAQVAPGEVAPPAAISAQQAAVTEPPAAASSAASQPDHPPPSASADHQVVEPPAPAAVSSEGADDRYLDAVSEQGQRARGLYVTAPMAHKLGARGVISMVRGAGFDAAVIDIKDGQGRISYDSQIEELAGSEHVFLKNPTDFVAQLKAAGVYAIARIVCFSDPVLPREYPDRAILDNRPGHVGDLWEKNAHRNTWLDPYNEKNHDLLVALAREVEAIGFQEIQLDYIRFPVDVATKFAVFPAQTETPRPAVLLGLLRRIDEAVHIPLGVDVFGVTAFHEGDPDGLGQVIDEWAKHVEVFSPMLYVHGMRNWMRRVKENRAGLLVEEGVKLMRRRVGPMPVIRPYLQGFPSRADYYNPEFIAEQIRGARSGGADGVLFWNPMSSYGMVREGALGPARTVMPFPNEERREAREGAWGGAHSAPSTVANETRPDKPQG